MKRTVQSGFCFVRSPRASAPSRSRSLTIAFAGSAGLLFGALPLIAQNASDDEVFELSPFTVDGSQDEGYRASSSLAGSRLRTDLKDIGAAISVVTKDLMDDLGATDLNDILLFTTNTEAAGLGGNFSGSEFSEGSRVNSDNVLNDRGSALRVRGIGAPDRTRGYFLTSIPFDNYNSDRIDISRGANSILFGLGSPAGVLNSGIYSANTNKDQGSIRFGIGSGAGSNWSYRTELDYNKVLLDDKLAVRITALNDDKRFRQDPTFEDQSRFYGALSYKPWKNGVFKANYESGTIDSNAPDPLAPIEAISSYLGSLKEYHAAVAEFGLNPKAVIPTSYDVNNLPLYWDSFALAIKDRTAYEKPNVIAAPGSFANPFSTSATGIFKTVIVAYDDATKSQPSYTFLGQVNAKTEVTDPNGYAAAGGAPAGYKVPGNAIAQASLSGVFNIGDTAEYEYQSLTDRSMYDFTNHLLAGTAGSQTKEFDASTLSFEQTFLENKLGFEVAFYEESYESHNGNPFRGSRAGITLDTQYTLPIGGLNPNFGRPYVIDRININNQFKDRDSMRVTAFAQYDFDKNMFADSFLGKMLGSHILSGLFSSDSSQELKYGQQEGWTSDDPAVNDILDVTLGTKQFQRQVAYMTYIGPAVDLLSNPKGLTWSDFSITPSAIVNQEIPAADGVVDAQLYSRFSPTLETYSLNRKGFIRSASTTKTEVDSAAIVLQSRWLDDALITTYGYREDSQDFATNSAPPIDPLDPYAQDFTVNPLYFNLNDTPVISSKGSTSSFSTVARLPRQWRGALGGNDIAVFYSKSDNLAPDASRLDAQLHVIPSPKGETEEYGITLSLLENKLNIRINHYESAAAGLTAPGASGIYGSIVNATMKVTQSALESRYAITNPNEIITDGGQFDGQPKYPHYDNIENHVNALQGLFGAKIDLQNKTFTLVDPSNPYAEFWKALRPELVINSAGEVTGLANVNVAGLTDTQDSISEGYEAEIVYNPTKNWRIMLNLAQQKTQTSNSLPNLRKLIFEDFGPVIYGTPGNPSLPGSYSRGTPAEQNENITNSNATWWESNVLNSFFAKTALDGSSNPEEREWRANLIANYSFSEGRFKGFSLGGSIRWQDKAAIGYPRVVDALGYNVPDPANSYFGEDEANFGVRFGYRRKIMENRVNWGISLNVNNITSNSDDLIPVLTHQNGEVAQYRVAAPTTWLLTNDFKF